MDPQVKNEWIEALRSGDYSQGRGALKVDDRYCCLGVLCDLYQQKVGGQFEANGFRDEHGYVSDLTLPFDVYKWAGLESDDPTIPSQRGTTLTSHNDGLDDCDTKTFDEIADLIEENL